MEVLDNWLRNHEGQPTWTEVADALDKIGLQHLATDIKNVYITGVYIYLFSGKFLWGPIFAEGKTFVV